MKYYIEKDGDGKVITKGITVDEAVLNIWQIEVTKDEFEEAEQFIPPCEEVLYVPTMEERITIAEDMINFLLGL